MKKAILMFGLLFVIVGCSQVNVLNIPQDPNFHGDVNIAGNLNVTGKINTTAIITNRASGAIITCGVNEIRGNATANKICLCTTENNWKCATVS